MQLAADADGREQYSFDEFKMTREMIPTSATTGLQSVARTHLRLPPIPLELNPESISDPVDNFRHEVSGSTLSDSIERI